MKLLETALSAVRLKLMGFVLDVLDGASMTE